MGARKYAFQKNNAVINAQCSLSLDLNATVLRGYSFQRENDDEE